MGQTQSRQADPGAADPGAAVQADPGAAAAGHRRHAESREAAWSRQHAAVASAALARCAALQAERESWLQYAAAAAVASAVAGAAVATVLTRHRQSGVLAEAARSIVDLRTRGARSAAAAERYAPEKLGKSLVPALDALDALVESGGDAQGAQLTRDSLHDALRAHGIERLEPPAGVAFDVATMEGMYTVAAAPSGEVAATVRPGWLLHGGERVLRAAQVGVGAGDTPEEEPDPVVEQTKAQPA